MNRYCRQCPYVVALFMCIVGSLIATGAASNVVYVFDYTTRYFPPGPPLTLRVLAVTESAGVDKVRLETSTCSGHPTGSATAMIHNVPAGAIRKDDLLVSGGIGSSVVHTDAHSPIRHLTKDEMQRYNECPK